MKKKALAWILALAMAVSLVCPALATGTETTQGESQTQTQVTPPTQAETLQAFLDTLSGLYEAKNSADAGLILTALAQDENGKLPENPVLPEGYTLPDLTASLDTKLSDLLAEAQVKALQALLDQETQAAQQETSILEQIVNTLTGSQEETEETKAAADWTLQELLNDLSARHQAVTDGNYEGQIALLTGLTQEVESQETTDEVTTQETEETPTPEICTICEAENCEKTHAQCEICQTYDCETEHMYCDLCEKYDCGLTHVYCNLCQKHDCGLTHVYCAICQGYDCGLDHEAAPEADLGQEAEVCEVCESDPCTCGPVVSCEECGLTGGSHEKICSAYVTVCTCTPIGEVHMAGCDFYVAPVSLFDEIMAGETVEDMYIVMLDSMYDQPEALRALTAEEINAIRDRVNELDPEGDDPDTQDLLDTLAVLPAMACSECGEYDGHAEDCVRNIQTLPVSGDVAATVISTNQDWNLTGDITLNGTITIKSGVKFRIRNDAAAKTVTVKRGNGFSGTMFVVEEGGSFQLNGYNWNDGQWNNGALVIDGNSKVAATGQIINCSGKLALRDTVLRNNNGVSAILLKGTGSGERYDTAHNKVVTIEITRTKIENCNASSGGGIYIQGDTPDGYSVDIWQSMLYQCTAVDASAVYLASAGQATVTMRNSVVDDCDTIDGSSPDTYGGAIRTNGNGNYKLEMSDCIVRNCDSWKFGGGVYWNASGENSKLTITDCQFLKNTAVSMGGGMFLEGSNMTITASTGTPSAAITTGMPGDLSGTLIQENSAPNGGGISYKCYSNNALIQVPVTVANFNENVIFKDNKGVNGAALAYNLHNTPNYPKDATFTFNINGAEFTNNTGTGFGGAIYVEKRRQDYQLTVNFESGSITNNTAASGGAIAIATTEGVTDGGTFNMKGGTLSMNTATSNGGAVYLQNGKFNMSGGTIESNKASTNGGALYVSGNVTMSDGTIQKNEATQNGGALYITGGNFTMTSGSMTENKATGTDSAGGAAYVNGGNVVIGVENCVPTDEDDLHTVDDYKTKTHPVIQNNSAIDSGGGIALIGDGNITMYCGKVTDNTATNRGRGYNVYMEDGTFNFHAGSVGKLAEPELVIVGGKLVKHGAVDTTVITLNYYHCNDTAKFTESHADEKFAFKSATATINEYFNLPDGEKYWDAPSGYRFFGWTFYGPDDKGAQDKVRDKTDYEPLGNPIKAVDNDEKHYDNKADGTINMYALWAPNSSKITFKGSVIDGIYDSNDVVSAGNAESYPFVVASDKKTLTEPVKAGYTFVGWYFYQDENQNANWGDDHEPVYDEKGALDFASEGFKFYKAGEAIEFGDTHFGNITLIAKFEPAYSALVIEKDFVNGSEDSNQNFVFHVSGTADADKSTIAMDVVVKGGGSVTIENLPVGDYTITEKTDWSWRYTVTSVAKTTAALMTGEVSINPTSVTLSDPTKKEVVTFTNKLDNEKWLTACAENVNKWSKWTTTASDAAESLLNFLTG